jgi:murein DD-endopeptidase MepM/ murein hydrolase activator NlpD
LWALSVSEQIREGISLNPGAKLQSAILGDGYVPVLTEKRFTSEDGRRWAWQPAERVSGDRPRRVYYCEIVVNGSTRYGTVYWFADGGDWGRPGTGGGGAGLVLAPVGTQEERLSGRVWPGEWEDSNPYGTRYSLRGQIVYHTGADLNLNSPRWNSDAGAPVFSCADGIVVFAGWFNHLWGNLVVIRHNAAGGFYSRSAHLGKISVAIGDTVHVGQEIGTVGGADVDLPDHLHFDISTSHILFDDPGDWPGADVNRLMRDYTDPKIFLQRAYEQFMEAAS